MRRSVIWSAALHILVLVLVIVGLPRLWDSRRVTDEPVILDVVNVGPKTTSKEMPKPVAKKKKVVQKKKPPPAPPKPKMAQIPPPPEPPKVAEKPAPKAEKVPVKPTPKPRKAPKKETKKPPAAKPPPRAIAQARPRHRPPPPRNDFLQSVLRDISPDKTDTEPRKKEAKKKPAPEPQQTAKAARRRAPLDSVVTTSEIDAIRHAIEQCWNIPAGARDAQDLVVSIRIWVNPDGTVREAHILDQSRMLKDTFFRTAAESALRAVLNPSCQPLPIPPKKYDQFKEMVLDFNPKTAAGS